MSYIGEREIKEIEHKDDEAIITFVEGEPSTMSETLLDLVITEEKKEGLVTDVVRMKLAVKFLTELADLGLENNMVEQVSVGMQTLVHNLREEAIGKAFGCHGALDIKLAKLLE